MSIPTIKPEWRTSTVVSLCVSMREQQDYSAMPILADALQDADCDDAKLLEFLRAGDAGKIDAERAVACVMSQDGCVAVQWMDDYAGAIGGGHFSDYNSRQMTYEILIDGARRYIDSGERVLGGSELEGEIVPDSFWNYYEAITGRMVYHHYRQSFFSCSC